MYVTALILMYSALEDMIHYTGMNTSQSMFHPIENGIPEFVESKHKIKPLSYPVVMLNQPGVLNPCCLI